MIQFSGVIITYNEERHIESCIRSLKSVADEIIVVDSYSTDKTVEICKSYNVTVIMQSFLGYIEQKNFALTKASHDYIISLDGDECLSKELQESIIGLKKNWRYNGYCMNRFNNFCGQWIKHSDWYPDKKCRVFHRKKAQWSGINPHDNIILYDNSEKMGFLKGDILHYGYQSYSEFNKKTEHFSEIAAKAYLDKGKKATLWHIFFNPTWAFFKAYFLRLGILDGLNGFIICYQTANLTFLKYIKLWALMKLETDKE